jgi:hypothetical protein
MGTVISLSSRRRREPRPELSSELSDWDLWLVGLLLWGASLARVAQASAEHEVFGAEATLAFLCTFLLPALTARRWLYRRSKAKQTRQRRRSVSSGPPRLTSTS